MAVFLQEVTIPTRCFLMEALMWVAVQRLPIATYYFNGDELHESRKADELIESLGGYLDERECQKLGLPLRYFYPYQTQKTYFLLIARTDENEQHRSRK